MVRAEPMEQLAYKSVKILYQLVFLGTTLISVNVNIKMYVPKIDIVTTMGSVVHNQINVQVMTKQNFQEFAYVVEEDAEQASTVMMTTAILFQNKKDNNI